MSKKTGISSGSLWLVTIILLAIAAWYFFKK
jgi:LPXTG-motif cell wall-anchored protein